MQGLCVWEFSPYLWLAHRSSSSSAWASSKCKSSLGREVPQSQWASGNLSYRLKVKQTQKPKLLLDFTLQPRVFFFLFSCMNPNRCKYKWSKAHRSDIFSRTDRRTKKCPSVCPGKNVCFFDKQTDGRQCLVTPRSCYVSVLLRHPNVVIVIAPPSGQCENAVWAIGPKLLTLYQSLDLNVVIVIAPPSGQCEN